MFRCYPMRMKPAKYLYHVEMQNSATRGTAVMPAFPVRMVSSHWSNIDPECRLLARFYPMRMKPSWIVSLDCISAQQHKFTHKYGECFYWVKQQNEFAWKIYTVCFHVGQMLFAGNKYLLLKRITVQPNDSMGEEVCEEPFTVKVSLAGSLPMF